ncbi:DUF447 domain-containing protein [Bythopirellula polymerisocia]|uniref:DUF447 family protein n=1 Tax=Bythopirellula polymerisocia TaxID=2528003 RepID=A0A5C6CDY5_9BACT|nr:DUF447 domain-containing protein [Bythopirellula polymerisocia]TWU22810.1 hypothetical protein Pla144_42710 [Bythopirellula polymerisocia]
MHETALPQLGVEGRILEAIVTTSNEDGSINIAPMGPIVDASSETLVLRPFRTSTTYHNLIRTHSGVLHITDDVLLFAMAAIGKVEPLPEFLSSEPLVLASACRWLKFYVLSVDDSAERSVLIARTTAGAHMREFFGFNRAMHAVIEAAILATRVQLLPPENLLAELARLESPVRKTGGAVELKAFALLREFINQEVASPCKAEDQPA